MSSFSLGLDIGGANLKFATSSGKGKIIYFPMWKRWMELEGELKKIASEIKAERIGIVTTAELSDVFSTKANGILKISKVVKRAFPSSKIYYLDINGNLKSRIGNPREFAASNWVAATKFLLRSYKNFILADLGSTTLDLIPVTDRIEAGKTDWERLKRGELLYFGVLRTPIFYILPKFSTIPLVPEYFAIAADAFIVTGDLKPDDYICDTPDGKGKDRRACMLRLARTLCCDLEELDGEQIKALAEAAKWSMVEKTEKAMRGLSEKYGLQGIIGCGLGEFILKEAAERAELDYVSIEEKYGYMSRLFPAYTMAKLVELE
jgi:hypothetical protein